MKLYEISKNSKFKIIDDGDIAYEEIYHLHHIDGMYSYCTTKDKEVVHISASAEVEVVSSKE